MILTVDFVRRYVVEPAHERGVSDERIDAITHGEEPTIEEVDVLGHAYVDLLRNDWSYNQNG